MQTLTALGLDRYTSAKFARNHICGNCGAELTEWHNGQEWGIACVRDKGHTAIAKRKSLSQFYKEGYALPVHMARNIEKRLGGKRMESTALTTMSEIKMMERIDKARFPQQMTPQDKKVLALVAISYGFDPLMGEVMLYQGRPYVSIDGRLRKAQETNELDGVQTRPATKLERDAWGIPEGDLFFHADIYRKKCVHNFEGWGRVTKIEIERAIKQAENNNKDPWFLPLIKDPQGIAEKRALAKGLRRAFHIPLPSVEDIGSSEDEAPTITVSEIPVNRQTGEVLEGTIEPPKSEAPAPAPTSVPQGQPPDAKTQRRRPYESIVNLLIGGGINDTETDVRLWISSVIGKPVKDASAEDLMKAEVEARKLVAQSSVAKPHEAVS